MCGGLTYYENIKTHHVVHILIQLQFGYIVLIQISLMGLQSNKQLLHGPTLTSICGGRYIRGFTEIYQTHHCF